MKIEILSRIKKYLPLLILPAFSVLLCAQNLPESAGVERYAIYVGSNDGGKNQQRLLYAGTDAIAFQKTMSEIGGISQSNAILLLDPTKEDLDFAMNAVSEKIRLNKANSRRSEFLFYYSGHSDETSLQLGRANYGYSELKAAITSVPSDVHVVILDSCFSGNFIRTKGGQKKKPFLLDDSAVVKGHAYLSSSSSQESSQESDEIGSSFFTNAMLTGLRGAADSSGDKKVTLNELYSYAFSETLSKTENTQAGPQHPNYNITLVGSGDLVLSDISNSDSVVMLSSDLNGRVILRDKNGKLVSEVNKTGDKPVYLALEKGEYSANLITKNVTMHGSFDLKSGKVYELSAKSLSPVASSFNRLRGEDKSSDSDSGEEEIERPDIPFAEDIRFLSDEEIYIPLELSFIDNEISRQYNKKVFTSFSLGLIRSSVYQVNGVMLAFGINQADFVRGVQTAYIFNEAKDLRGAQSSGIFNRSHDVKGVQSAGIFNSAHDVIGAQVSGIFNSAHDYVGIQFSGIYNTAYDMRGLQVSGIFNSAADFTGVQASGILNKAGDMKGLQAAGIGNVAGVFEGLQVSGGFNYARSLEKGGMQVGLVNVANYSEGIQFGLLNISRNGMLEVGMSLTSNGNTRFTLNSGNRHLYTVLGVVGRTKDFFTKHNDEEISGIVLAGLGTRFCLGMFNFDFEGIANFSGYKKDEAEIEAERAKAKDDEEVFEYDVYCFPSFRFSVGYTPIKHLNIFAGAIFSFETSDNEKGFENLNSNLSFDTGNITVHPEFEAGIRFSFN